MTTATKYTATPLEDIPVLRDQLVRGFLSGKLKSIQYRKDQLLSLCYMVQDNLPAFKAALKADLGRPELEASFLELGAVISEVLGTYKSVEKWSKPEKPSFNLNSFPMSPVVRKEAKGVVLIIVPFNYPIWLAIGPVASAIAAGNTVLLKPSEFAPHCSALTEELLNKYIDPDVVRVVQGAVPETTKLLELQWDHILYTGSSKVAKIVATAAAQHLTPVTLELGGKSPVIVDPKTDLDLAARRILWGKLANAGQTCVAPDYVLIPRDAQDSFVDALLRVYHSFYPEGPAKSESFSRIVTDRHLQRIKTLISNTKGTIVIGGETNESDRYLAPTIVKDIRGDDSLMSEELFGPVLPIVPVDSIDEAIRFINARDHPLALYVFTQDSALKTKIFDNTQSGAAIANEVVIHCGIDGLPFGGVGPSGYGAHTGKFGFDLFTHHRASLDNPKWIEKILGGRYPPYTKSKQKSLEGALMPSKLPPRNKSTTRWGRWAAVLFISAVIVALKGKSLRSLVKA